MILKSKVHRLKSEFIFYNKDYFHILKKLFSKFIIIDTFSIYLVYIQLNKNFKEFNKFIVNMSGKNGFRFIGMEDDENSIFLYRWIKTLIPIEIPVCFSKYKGNGLFKCNHCKIEFPSDCFPIVIDSQEIAHCGIECFEWFWNFIQNSNVSITKGTKAEALNILSNWIQKIKFISPDEIEDYYQETSSPSLSPKNNHTSNTKNTNNINNNQRARPMEPREEHGERDYRRNNLRQSREYEDDENDYDTFASAMSDDDKTATSRTIKKTLSAKEFKDQQDIKNKNKDKKSLDKKILDPKIREEMEDLFKHNAAIKLLDDQSKDTKDTKNTKDSKDLKNLLSLDEDKNIKEKKPKKAKGSTLKTQKKTDLNIKPNKTPIKSENNEIDELKPRRNRKKVQEENSSTDELIQNIKNIKTKSPKEKLKQHNEYTSGNEESEESEVERKINNFVNDDFENTKDNYGKKGNKKVFFSKDL